MMAAFIYYQTNGNVYSLDYYWFYRSRESILEEIAEGAVKGLLRFIRFLLTELFSETLTYWLGRIFLKAVTLGRYPPTPETAKDRDRIITTGVIVIILTVVAISISL